MFVTGVVGATLDVAPKGFGFAGIGGPKALVGLEGCMWGTKAHPKFTYGQAILTDAELLVARPSTVALHTYYMKGCL